MARDASRAETVETCRHWILAVNGWVLVLYAVFVFKIFMLLFS